MPNPDIRFPIPDSFVARLRSAARLTILTGAGVSSASGVPTFRGEDGLWRQFRPEELATAAAFRRDPSLVWEWYAWRRATIAGCEPNAAHHVIASWSQRNPWGLTSRGQWCTVITQNVDDLHVRAGTRDLIRLHGSIWEMKCWNGCGHRSWRDEGTVVARVASHASSGSEDTSLRPGGDMPRCPGCGGLARPAVVWFGESLDPRDVDAAQSACDCDLFLTIGTSSVVYPAAGLVHEAKRRGAFTAEINLDATPASSVVDLAIRGPAEIILPQLAHRD